MSRVVVFGIGLPSFVSGRRHAGPGLRCGHFVTALVRSGHQVLVVTSDVGERTTSVRVERQRPVEVDGHPVSLVDASEPAFESEALRSLVRAFRPDALVAATVYGASLALRLRLKIPLWADVFGDFMAEAQAKAVVSGNDAVLVRFWQTLAPVLERGDRFSCVSEAQRWALFGQLGMAGRLGAATAAEDLVVVVPCAAETRLPARAPTRVVRGTVVSPNALIVLWSGSFNTWCDVDTLFAGLEHAMAHNSRVCFVATGGEVPGHDESTYRRFSRLVAGSAARERYHLLGWVDDEVLGSLAAEADVGVHIERDLLERRLGSENRVVQWAVQGLPCVTTGRSELGAWMVAQGLAFGIDPDDGEALGRTLCALEADRSRIDRAGRACRRYAQERWGYDVTAAPLVTWCDRPDFASDKQCPPALSVGLYSEPSSLVHVLEAYLDDLSFGQIVYRSLRWAVRRFATRSWARVENRRDGN